MTYNKLERIYDAARLPRLSNEFYYIYCKSEGKVCLLGPYNSESEANQVAVSKLSGAYEVIPLKTRDRSRATSILKHRLLTESGDLGEALRRVRHSV